MDQSATRRRKVHTALRAPVFNALFGASSDNIPLFVSNMTFTIQNIPAGLRALARILMQRDGIDAFDAWHDHIDPALEDLAERLTADNDAGEFIDEADFMQEHFGLEPDHFTDLLTHLA